MIQYSIARLTTTTTTTTTRVFQARVLVFVSLLF
jgi:hypothetical protein